MKKFYILFIAAFVMLSFRGNSQIVCNSDFSFNFITASSVQFTPFNTISTVQHYWKFGDGTTSNAVAPLHNYSPGVYLIKHFIVSLNPNGVPFCSDSTDHAITIQQNPCNLNASFTSQNSTSTPGQIYFVNTSSGFNAGDSIRWTFGDGTSSYDVNPSHTYTAPGTYMVCLRVKKHPVTASAIPCVSEICHTVTVTSPTISCNLQVYFSAQPDQGQPSHIMFTNQSIGYVTGDSVTWNFGDGNFAYTSNTDHLYTAPGTYTVCLTIKKNNTSPSTPPCIRTYCKVITIAAPCNLVAGFTWTASSSSPNTFHFTNTTAPLSTTDSVRWTFGDGTSSNNVNPTHTYTQPGSYNVCLRVQQRTATGGLTNCIREICHVIIVQTPCNIQPAFTWQADQQNTKKIYFTNTTTTTAANAGVTWLFGDGTSATTWNAIHTYAQPGTYNVCLRIQFGTCITYHCDSVTVTVPPPSCTQLSNFQILAATASGAQTAFVATNIFPDVQYTWTFGDGTGMQGPTATHHYATPGTYTVCLTAFRNNSCASTKCMTITIPALFNCNNITIGFTNVPNANMPNSIKLTATSNAAITDQVWTITRTPATIGSPPVTIHANDPVFVFPQTGYYNVCLQATYANGCVKTYCRTIYVSTTTSVPPPATCAMQVYPNPAFSVINASVTLTQPLVLYAYIYNNMNMLVVQKIQQGVIGNNTVNMNIAALTPGVYTLRLVYGNMVCYSTFIKQ